jgi:hypothetical protein
VVRHVNLTENFQTEIMKATDGQAHQPCRLFAAGAFLRFPAKSAPLPLDWQ